MPKLTWGLVQLQSMADGFSMDLIYVIKNYYLMYFIKY